MPRTPDPDRRPELLDQIVDYIAEHGVADLSLRPLAKALGQSTFVLSYHFGDKDGLLAAALKHFEDKQRAMLVAWSGWDRRASFGAIAKRFWAWMLEDRNIRLLRVGFELATTRGGAFAANVSREWVDFLTDSFAAHGLDKRRALDEATLYVATVNGLLLDHFTTGDRRRLDRALERYADRIDAMLRTTRGRRKAQTLSPM